MATRIHQRPRGIALCRISAITHPLTLFRDELQLGLCSDGTRVLQRLSSMVQQLLFALRREVDDLVQLQIQALTQQSALNASQLRDCRARFERIMHLQEEVARLRTKSILGRSKRLLLN